MYRKVDSPSTQPEEFELPFEGKLLEDNRWVIRANLILWSSFEEEYAKNFAAEMGASDVDKIYRTCSNRAFCKERGIRISGPPLLLTPS